MRDAFLAAPSMTITNDALSRISRKYTSRISDLRAAGYEIAVTQRDFRSGLTHYTMIRKP